MSHIDPHDRAAKAYTILADQTNVHLPLVEMIYRLQNTKSFDTLRAAHKALTGETKRGNVGRHLVREFFHALDITGGSYDEKRQALNAFGEQRRQAH